MRIKRRATEFQISCSFARANSDALRGEEAAESTIEQGLAEGWLEEDDAFEAYHYRDASYGPLVRPKLDYRLLGTEIRLDSTKVYRATWAKNQPDWQEKKKVFVSQVLLEKGDYEVMPEEKVEEAPLTRALSQDASDAVLRLLRYALETGCEMGNSGGWEVEIGRNGGLISTRPNEVRVELEMLAMLLEADYGEDLA